MKLSADQINDLATALVGIIKTYYSDPTNEEDYQKWIADREDGLKEN